MLLVAEACCWAAMALALAACTALWSAALWAAAAWVAALMEVASWFDGPRVRSQAPTRMTAIATSPPTMSSVRLVFSVSRTIDMAGPSPLLRGCNAEFAGELRKRGRGAQVQLALTSMRYQPVRLAGDTPWPSASTIRRRCG